jgi:hypothetical protein
MNTFPTENIPFRHRFTPRRPDFHRFQPISWPQANRKPADTSTGAATQMTNSFMETVEKLGHLDGLRWRTALRQHRGLGGECFVVQMRQDFLNNGRIFNASNDLDLHRAALTGLESYTFSHGHIVRSGFIADIWVWPLRWSVAKNTSRICLQNGNAPHAIRRHGKVCWLLS